METLESRPKDMEEPTSCGSKVKAGLLSLWRGSKVNRKPFSPAESELFYKIDDGPPLLASIVLGIQQATLDISGSLSVAFSIGIMLCAGDDSSAMAKIISTSFVMCGAATIFQTAFGSRLPIAQGGSSSFLVPIVVLTSAPSWRCPGTVPDNDACFAKNTTAVFDADFGWQERMQQLQGSLIAASCVEVFLGVFGLTGLLLRFIGPLTIAVVISLIGLSLAPLVRNFASLHWGVSLGTLAIALLFSLYLGGITIPVPQCGKKKTGERRVRVPVFRLFSIFLATVLMWLLCYILTVTGYLDDAENHIYPDNKNLFVDTNKTRDAIWFYFPYPGQFGTPSFNLVAFLGFTMGTLTSVVESIGDYHAAAVVCGLPPPPQHAINRGLAVEGCSGVLSGLLGTGHATTSYSGNIGAISLTQVASRRVFYCAGLILVLCGISGKFAAALSAIPQPIIGSFLFMGLSLVIGVGLANVSKVNLESPRNIAILGLSLMAGLVIPPWVQDQSKACAINTGYTGVDQLLTAVFGTSMMVGGLVACFLDNTVPGSLEDRGMVIKSSDSEAASSGNADALKAYDLPFFCSWIKKSFLRHLPVCPGFQGFNCCRRKESTDHGVPNDAFEKNEHVVGIDYKTKE